MNKGEIQGQNHTFKSIKISWKREKEGPEE